MNAAGWPMDELVVGGQLTSNGKVRNGVICCKKILNNGFGPAHLRDCCRNKSPRQFGAYSHAFRNAPQ
jgi:hypothetical protein